MVAACGGSSGKDLGADPGADTPSVNDLAADEAGPSDTGLDDTIGRDVPEVSPDSIGPEEVAIEDLPPEPEPDVPPMDEGVTGDLSSEIVPSDVPPEPGDPCEGPECVPCPDDGLECTDSVHGGDDGACVVVVKAGSCLIDGVCFLPLLPRGLPNAHGREPWSIAGAAVLAMPCCFPQTSSL